MELKVVEPGQITVTPSDGLFTVRVMDYYTRELLASYEFL